MVGASPLMAWEPGPRKSERSRRRGLEERTERRWEKVGSGGSCFGLSMRVVRAEVCDFSKPHDEI